MADKINMSLDQIIKQDKSIPRNRGGRRGGGSGGPRRFGNRNGFGRRQANGGSIQKRRSGGASLNASLSPNKAAAAAASSNGQWSHDLYQNANALNNSSFRRNQSLTMANATGGPAKLVISNLDFGVNDQDIEGLFQEFGKIKKAAVHYDRTGRSLGTADVVFERKSDAIRALTHYNGVSLDGRPMNIQLTASLSARMPGGRIIGGGLRRGNNSGGPRRGAGGPRRGQRRGQRPNIQKKQVKSAADLDADLDAHNAKMQTD